MTLRARSCALAALVTAGLALYTESAQADAAGAAAPIEPTCRVALAASEKGLTLPANAPALIVVDRSYGSATTPTLAAAFLDGATRTDLAAGTDTHGLWILSLPAPGAGAGAYDVEVTSTCPQIDDEETITVPLTLTAPVAFPTSVGSLVHVPADPPTGVDKIRFEPTEGMAAFLAAARIDLVVNGTKSTSRTFVNAGTPIEMTVNTGDVCIENGALHRDKRVVKVTLEGAIAGVAEAPAAAAVDVPVDCGAIKWTSMLPPKDGSTTSGSSGGTTGTGGTNTTSSISEGSSAGGCAAAPVDVPGHGSGLAAFALGAVALVALRRRRH